MGGEEKGRRAIACVDVSARIATMHKIRYTYESTYGVYGVRMKGKKKRKKNKKKIVRNARKIPSLIRPDLRVGERGKKGV